MAELDRFERRLAAGLERLADEVPTAVDAAAVAHRIAAAEAQRRGRSGRLAHTGPGTHGLAPVLRFALAPVALLLLVFGIIVLAERIAPAPSEGLFAGRAVCEGAPWTSATDAVAVDCILELADPRLAGPLRIVAGPATDAGGYAVRTGTLELRGSDATWTGALLLQVGRNGLASGTARLGGDGAAEGCVLDVRLVSADGVDWGVLATVVPAPGGESEGAP
jgi:hypothetical protein